VDIVKTAEEMGFELAGPIEASAIECKRELRDYCNPEECPQYASCWSCPPGAGSFEECRERIASCSCGVVVQTVREGVDFNDVETLAEIRTLHNGRLDELADAVRGEGEGVYAFTTGGCRVCPTCTYPDEPCRYPQKQRLSLSAHGVDVAALCEHAGIEYGFESGTIRFVGMVLQ